MSRIYRWDSSSMFWIFEIWFSCRYSSLRVFLSGSRPLLISVNLLGWMSTRVHRARSALDSPAALNFWFRWSCSCPRTKTECSSLPTSFQSPWSYWSPTPASPTPESPSSQSTSPHSVPFWSCCSARTASSVSSNGRCFRSSWCCYTTDPASPAAINFPNPRSSRFCCHIAQVLTSWEVGPDLHSLRGYLL